MNDRPAVVTTPMLEFLDDLRESNKCNMFAAKPYLIEEFGLTDSNAQEVTKYWMKSFGQPSR